MRYVSTRAFKSMVRRKEATAGVLLRRDFPSTVAPLNDRTVKFTISTECVARDGDVIRQSGWQLDNFMRNPVVLWAHRGDEPPVGRCTKIGVVSGKLTAVVEYVPADMPRVGDLAEMCLRMNREGFLNATSVGFTPLEWEVANERDDGEAFFVPLDYTKVELLEFSLVSVPADPNALIDSDDRRSMPELIGRGPHGNLRERSGEASWMSRRQYDLRRLYG